MASRIMVYDHITPPQIIRELHRERAQRNLYEFVKYTFRRYSNPNWHHRLMCRYYQDVIEGKIDRLMIFAPPRHMKTEALERAIAYAIGKDLDIKIMICAYGTAKSRKISTHIKEICKDEKIKEVFRKLSGKTIFDGIDTADYWEIGGGYSGRILAAGVGGSITGEGFNLACIDDPIKSREEAESITYQFKTADWYWSTFLSRQDEKNSRIIITTTRWSKKDLCGQILEIEGIKEYNGMEPHIKIPEFNGQSDGRWTVLCLPAIMDEEAYKIKHPDDKRQIGEALWPEKFPVEFLDQFRRNKYNWNSLYQNRPVPRGGNLIDRGWFTKVDVIPVMERYVRFWDFAGTPKEAGKQSDPDFTAGALIGVLNGNYYIIDIKCIRDTPQKVENLVLRTAKEDNFRYENVKILYEEEGGASGKHQTDYYNRLLSLYNRSPFRTSKAKEFYIDLLANKAETGNIFVCLGNWLNDLHDGNTFFDEAESFPRGNHDDRIDATAKGIYFLSVKAEYQQPDFSLGMAINQDKEFF